MPVTFRSLILSCLLLFTVHAFGQAPETFTPKGTWAPGGMFMKKKW
ncbi:MAG: hypothetical protein V4616_00280 [Bacteroidota bacterium]